jgi:hypothetical protein
MKAKTDINIYHNTVVIVNQKAFEANRQIEGSGLRDCLMPE